MVDRLQNILPPFTEDTPLRKPTSGFTSTQKKKIYKARGRIDELSRKKLRKGLSHVHHMHPRSQGGPEIRRNAMILGDINHQNIHDYCWKLTKRDLPEKPTFSNTFKKRWAHNVYWISYELREATRASMIDQGYDPRFVYQEEYLYDEEVRLRIDTLLGIES